MNGCYLLAENCTQNDAIAQFHIHTRLQQTFSSHHHLRYIHASFTHRPIGHFRQLHFHSGLPVFHIPNAHHFCVGPCRIQLPHFHTMPIHNCATAIWRLSRALKKCVDGTMRVRIAPFPSFLTTLKCPLHPAHLMHLCQL